MEEARVATVVVDTNSGEDFIFDKLGAKLGEARVSRRRLDVGDVHIACDGRLLIVERKSWADLQSSLTDGRLREQKARQMAAVAETPGARVIWLINGQLHSWHATVPPASLPAGRAEAALINAAVGDDIPVLRARDDEGVVETLAHLATKLEAGRLDGGAAAQVCAAAQPHSSPTHRPEHVMNFAGAIGARLLRRCEEQEERQHGGSADAVDADACQPARSERRSRGRDRRIIPYAGRADRRRARRRRRRRGDETACGHAGGGQAAGARHSETPCEHVLLNYGDRDNVARKHIFSQHYGRLVHGRRRAVAAVKLERGARVVRRRVVAATVRRPREQPRRIEAGARAVAHDAATVAVRLGERGTHARDSRARREQRDRDKK